MRRRVQRVWCAAAFVTRHFTPRHTSLRGKRRELPRASDAAALIRRQYCLPFCDVLYRAKVRISVLPSRCYARHIASHAYEKLLRGCRRAMRKKIALF